MSERLDGLVALITGAGGGIGRGVALTFAREGASVVVNDLGTSPFGGGSDVSRAKSVVDEIRADGGIAVENTGDITDPVAAEAMVNQAIATYGKLDILVNVAGTTRLCTILDATDDDWDSQMRTHLRGYFNTTRYAARHWVERGEYGRLINFTSGAGHTDSPPSVLSYGTAKAGVIGFTRGCANALAVYNVTANLISPGSYGTPMAAAIIKGAESSNTEGTKNDPIRISPIVAFLASPRAGHVSGRVFGAAENDYALFSEPSVERGINRDFLIDPDGVYEEIENSLCADLSLADLPYPTIKLPSTWRDDYGLFVPRLDPATLE